MGRRSARRPGPRRRRRPRRAAGGRGRGGGGGRKHAAAGRPAGPAPPPEGAGGGLGGARAGPKGGGPGGTGFSGVGGGNKPDGTRIFSSHSGQRDDYLDPGRYNVICEFPANPLRPRHYAIELQARGTQNQDIVPSALIFELEGGSVEEENPAFSARVDGFVRVPADWSPIMPALAGEVDAPAPA